MKIRWDILRRSVRGSLERHEEELLAKWLGEKASHLETYKKISEYYASEHQSIVKTEEQTEIDFRRLMSKIEGKRRYVRLRRISISAAAVVVAAVVALFTLDVFDIQRSNVSLIVPGSPKAELILASGQVLPLDTQSSENVAGMVITNDPTTGKVHYTLDNNTDIAENTWNTLTVPNGGEYSLTLPDGTEIWINSGSSLRFPGKFSSSVREVFLSGEAFFVVAKDENAPFMVHSDGRTVRVTGTSFNISSYLNDRKWQATLVEGSVTVAGTDREVAMSPSQQYDFDKVTGNVTLKTVDTKIYTSWIEGRFYFRNEAFGEIIRKLERWYNFEMKYDDDAIMDMRFTGFVDKHQPIDELLGLIEMTNDVSFSVNGATITAARKKQ